MRLKVVALSLIAILMCCISARAQQTTGSISGTVKDPSGAVVPNATVTLTDTDKNAVIGTTKTGTGGDFSFPALLVGHYSITVEAPNFQKYVQTGITLNANDKLTFFPQLQVGSTSQAVTVEASSAQVELQSAQQAGLISGTQVRELALNNRNYEQLVTLQPGVADSGNSDQFYVGAFAPFGTNVVTFSVNGGRREENNWQIDGADNVDRGSNLTLQSFPSVDAISEVRIVRGVYDADSGRSAGGQVNVITRSGTSSLHGGVFEFFRNDYLNANAPFNKVAQESACATNPALPCNKPAPLRYNNFGGTIGGPVWIPKIYEQRNKTFFFVSEEARRVITYTNGSADVPTVGMLQGNFVHPVCTSVNHGITGGSITCNATGTSIPSTSWNPIAAAYIHDIFSKYQSLGIVPNNPASGDIFNNISTLRNVFNFREDLVKIDHIVSQRLALSGKILRDTIPTVEPGGLFTGLGIDHVGTTNTNSPGNNYTVHATVTFSPTLLLEVGYGYSYNAIISNPVGLISTSNATTVVSAFNGVLPFTSTLTQVPNLSFSNGTGVASFGPYRDYDRNHTVLGNLTKVIGSHALKFGGIYYHYQKTENAGSGNQGSFGFTGLGVAPAGTAAFEQSWANFLLVTASSFSQTSIDIMPDIHDNQFEYYGQDTWRVRPNFTLTYGVRQSFFRQPTDAKGLLSQFDPATYDPTKAPCVLSNGNLDTSLVNGKIVSACNPNFTPLNGLIFTNPPTNYFGYAGTKSPFGSKVSNEFNRAIAPRIGIAWDPLGDGRTAIRAGYGMFYDNGLEFGNPEINVFNNPGFVTTVATSSVAGSVATLSAPSGGSLKFSSGANSLNSRIPMNYKSPYTQQWSLDVQREFAHGWMLDVGYFGNNGIHLPGYIDSNQPAPGAYLKCTTATPCFGGPGSKNAVVISPNGNTAISGSSNAQLLNAIRPFIGYAGGFGFQTMYTANYNSLQSMLQKTFAGGSVIGAAYTWSHCLTTNVADRTTGQTLPVVSSQVFPENYGPCVADRRQVFNASFVYNLPFFRAQQGFVGHVLGGWELSGIQTAQTGVPFTTTSGVGIDPAGTGCTIGSSGLSPCANSSFGTRPFQVCNPNDGAPHTNNAWFNASCFVEPTAATTSIVGMARPGAVYLPGFWRTDLSLFKNVKFTERLTGQLRWETFNSFNHFNPVYSMSSVSTSGTYNKITASRDPRIMQLGIKLNF